MRKITAILLFIGLFFTGLTSRDRLVLRLPEIEGYQIVKCDFHSHTVFSDGHVWPDFRVGEAWADGLDALAISDHIEYRPHEKDLSTNHNRSFELAKGAADAVGITLIKAAEITRDMPPGHLNVLFLTDVDKLDTESWRDAVKAAYKQGAFIFWNHPGWTGQQPDGISRWYDEHDELLAAGILHGIEVVNSDEYYPTVYQWCIEKKLTILGNSDIHSTTDMDYNHIPGNHRPMTWVLAKSKEINDIKEALFARRTIVYWRDILIGEKHYLEPLFFGAIRLETPTIVRAKGQQVQIANLSDLLFELELVSAPEGVSAPQSFTLQPGHATRLRLGFDKEKAFDRIKLDYVVSNLQIGPEEGLPVSWSITVD